MAQSPIREFDAKRMFAEFQGKKYSGFLVQKEEDLIIFEDAQIKTENGKLKTNSWVIKPDELFGKRGKYGLIGVNLSSAKVRDWWKDHIQKEYTIGESTGELQTFLIEPFVVHTEEYYVAIKTERDYDEIFFSASGGIEIEENWNKVISLKVPLKENLELKKHIEISFDLSDSDIIDFIASLYSFFNKYGFSYLEVNPCTKDITGEIVCLDMVARVDTCEAFRQKHHWGNLSFPHPFGVTKAKREEYIEELDASTGASLKLRILNPEGRIWLLTSGGGASVIIADTIADMGYASEVGNYGECSGNPDRENTKAYTLVLLDIMLENKILGKYLIIAGAIANFTHIDKTFGGIIDAFSERYEEMKQQKVQILVRRGGINDAKGLQMMQEACENLGLPCQIADGNSYMTDILHSIKL